MTTTAEPSPLLTTATQSNPPLSDLPPSEGAVSRISKRIIICCDGTWQNGIESLERWRYSNVLKLARMINRQDERQNPPMPQIVFYQAGIGCDHNLYSELVNGATGSSLFEKVLEVYAFIAHNYQEGDEIFLFGFSRGAYTARMTAHFIGEIGILDRHDLEHFEQIFKAYQIKNKPKHKNDKTRAEMILKDYHYEIEKSKKRADVGGNSFSIKCLGVFDTVGSLGLPTEVCLTQKSKQLFIFPDNYLGAHIEHGYHAMALHETRVDFEITLFEQTKEGRERGQMLKQVWFAGSHADIGGGYHKHDLSDISLIWMTSNLERLLSLDLEYLQRIPEPFAPWGTLPPHNSKKGIFMLSRSKPRPLPRRTCPQTHEYIHPSVKHQRTLNVKVKDFIENNSGIVWELTRLEETMRDMWKPNPPDSKAPARKGLGCFLASVVNTLLRASIDIISRGQGGLPEERSRPLQSRTGRFSALSSKRLSGKISSELP